MRFAICNEIFKGWMLEDAMSYAAKSGLFRENPPGAGSFVWGLRWLGRHRPRRGCSGLVRIGPWT
jgi:hypothetical protein